MGEEEKTVFIIGGSRGDVGEGGIEDLEIRNKLFQELLNSLIEEAGRKEDWSQKFRKQREQKKEIKKEDYEEIKKEDYEKILRKLGFNLEDLSNDEGKRRDMIFIIYHLLSLGSNLRALRNEGRGETDLYYAKMTNGCNNLAALSLGLNSEEFAKLFEIVKTTLQIKN
jgi:hypothetical protein